MRHYLLFLLVGLGVVLLAACSKDEPEIALNTLPEGDPARGERLFNRSINGAVVCSACHTITTTQMVGPGLEGFGERAGRRVAGQSAEEYAYYSILRPSRHTVRGFSNVMPGNYEEVLNAADLADLIAYILSL